MYAMFRVLRFQISELLGYDDVFHSFFLLTQNLRKGNGTAQLPGMFSLR